MPKKQPPPPAAAAPGTEGGGSERDRKKEKDSKDKDKGLSTKHLDQLIEVAKAQPKDIISDDDFEAGVAAGKTKSGLGIDFAETMLVSKAPRAAKRRYLKVIHGIQTHLLWPQQVYHNKVLKIGKPAGGERAIGLMAGLYRLMGRALRPSILDWSKKKAGFWDNAISGSAGLKAAIRRIAFAEVHVGAGWHVGSIFGDYQAFSENLDWVMLMEAALTKDYPLAPLVLGMQLHMAPRTIHVCGAVPGGTQIPCYLILCFESPSDTQIHSDI